MSKNFCAAIYIILHKEEEAQKRGKKFSIKDNNEEVYYTTRKRKKYNKRYAQKRGKGIITTPLSGTIYAQQRTREIPLEF